MATFNSDGTASDINSIAASAGTHNGDTITVPAGTHNWDATVRIQKNIKLIGKDSPSIVNQTLPKITKSAGLQRFIWYTCQNTADTCEIGNLELFGDAPIKITVDGVQPIIKVGNTYSGGMVIHDVRLSRDMQLVGQGGAGAVNGLQFQLQDWVMGVMYHCEVRQSLNAGSAATFKLAHNLAPTGVGWSDSQYSDWSYDPASMAGRTDLAGCLDMWVFEDNIFRLVKSVLDCPGDGGGGTRYMCRHNTTWAAFSTHGSRESGSSGARGARIIELYNNHTVRNSDALQGNKGDAGSVECRDGEHISYNNYITGQAGIVMNEETMDKYCSQLNPYGYITIVKPADTRFAFGADGLNPWDKNAKGNASGVWNSPYTNKNYHILSTYSYDTRTNPPGPDSVGMQFGYINNVNVHADLVVNGRDQDPRFSDVFGKVTPGVVTNIDKLDNLTITGEGLPTTPVGSSLTGYFDGFIIRNAEVSRCQFSKASAPGAAPPSIGPQSWRRILHSVGTSTDGTTATNVTFYLDSVNPGLASPDPAGFALSGNHIEIRRVEKYAFSVGNGQMSVSFKKNSDPAELNEASGPNNPRWVQEDSPGLYTIGNRRRVGGGVFNDEGDIDYQDLPWAAGTKRSTTVQVIRTYQHGRKWCYTYGPGQANGPGKPGYDWNPTFGTITGPNLDVRGPNTGDTGPAECRVGADWSNIYVEGHFDTTQNDTAFQGGTPEFASFYVKGAVIHPDLPYPHPLRQAPVAAAPVWISPFTANFAPGVPESFSIVASGATSFTKNSPASMPPGMTFSSSGQTLTLTGDNNTVAGITTYSFRATNATGSTDQNITITIDTPAISAWNTPVDNFEFFHDVGTSAIVSFSVNVTALSGINRVDFYSDGNIIGTDNTGPSPYTFVWSDSSTPIPVTDGTHTIKLRAYDTGLDFTETTTRTIKVTTNVVVAPPAPASINVRG